MSGDPQSYSLSIDWLGAGGTPDNGDTTYLLSYMIDRGRNQTFTGDPVSGEAKLARNKVGQLSFILDNSTRRYDTYNPNSALYPNVVPGKAVKFFVTDDLANTYALFTGTIDDIRPVYGDDPRVQIVCSDAWKKLSQNPMSTQMYLNSSVDKPTTEIIGYAGMQMGNNPIGSETFPYIWGDDDTPYQVLHDLWEMDGGYLWIGGDGKFYAIPRTVAQAQTPALTLTQSQILRDIQVSQPWDGIINYVIVGIHDLTRNPNQVLVWTTPDVAMIPAGGRITRRIQYTGANGKRVPIRSLAGADGTIFNMPLQSSPVGTGTILPGETITTKPPGGAVALQITIVNKSNQTGYLLFGSAAAQNLCGGKLFSHPLDDLNPSTQALYDATSIALYGTRTLRLDYRYMQGLNNANKVAAHYLARFKDPRATITVKIVNRSTIQFAYDLNTLINFTSAYLTGQSTDGIVKAPTVAASVNNPNSTGIINPGFESGDLRGWLSYFVNSNGSTNWSVGTAAKKNGSYGVQVITPAGGVDRLYSDKYSIVPSQQLTASVWGYVVNLPTGFTTGGWNLWIEFFASDKTTSLGAFSAFGFQTAVGSWSNPSGVVTAPVNAYYARVGINVQVDGSSGDFTGYFDDISLAGVSGVWNYPNNALLQDGSGAYADTWREVSPASQLYTDYLVLTGFGFTAQPTDVINGISVRIRKKTNVSPPGTMTYPGGSVDYGVKLVKAGVIAGNNKAKPETWTNQYADYIYGSPNDLWGVSLTYADVNASTFGVAIAAGCALCNADRGWATAYVEYVEITLYTSNGAFQKAFRVVGIKHQSGRTPYEVTTTWTLEPTINNSGMLSPNQITDTPHAGEMFPIGGGISY